MRSWLPFSAIWFDPTLKHNIFYPTCIIYVKYLLCSLELIVPNDLKQKLKLFEVFLLNRRKRIYSNTFKPQANYKLLSLMRSLTSFVLREKYTELEAFYIKYNKKNLRDACSLRTRPWCALWSAIKTWAMQKRIEMSTATFLMALKHDKWQISLWSKRTERLSEL